MFCIQGAGVEIYPGSVCSLVGNGIHHCKDGVLIKVKNNEMTLIKIALIRNEDGLNFEKLHNLDSESTCSTPVCTVQTGAGMLTFPPYRAY